MTRFSTIFAFAALLTLSGVALAQDATVDSHPDPAQMAAMIERLQRTIAEAQAALNAQLKRAPVAAARPAQGVAPAPAPSAQESTPDETAPESVPSTPVVEVTAKNGPKYDPLRLRVVMRFPANVKTIQQASQYLLETANYKLALNPANEEESRAILSRPLLPQDRDGSLRTIEDGLLQISGDDTILIIDRDHKMVSFELMKKK